MNVGKYYVAGIPFDSENSLKHYGVKGMEWDKHKFGLDADTRYIKWVNPNDLNVGSYGKYGKMAEAAAKQKYGAAAPTPKGRLTTVYNKQSVMNSRDSARRNMAQPWGRPVVSKEARDSQKRQREAFYNQAMQEALKQKATADRAAEEQRRAQQKWNNSPIGKASNFVTGTANRAGKAIGTAATNAGQWANQQAQNAGRAIGTAANQASKWAGQQAQNVGNAVGQAAGNVGNAVGGAANAVGNWVGTQVQNVANSAPVQAVGNAVSGAAQNAGRTVQNAVQNVGNTVGDWARNANNFIDQNITGNSDRARAEGYQKIADDFGNEQYAQKAQNAQEQADNSLFGRIGNTANAVGNWFGDRAQDVSQAAQNVGNAVGDFFSNRDEYQRLDDLSKHYDPNTGTWDSEENRKAFYDAQDAYNRHPATAIPDMAGEVARNVKNFVDYNVTGDGQRRIADMLMQNPDQVNKIYENDGSGWKQVSQHTNAEAAERELADAKNNTLFGKAGQAANAVGQAAKTVGNTVSGAANKAAEGAKGFLNSAGQWVSGAANNVKNTASKAVSDASKGASGFLNSAGQWVSNAAGNVGKAAQDAGKAVSNAAQNVGNTVGQAAEQTRGGIGGLFDRVGNAVGGAANAVGDWAGNAVGGVANAVGDWAGQAVQDVGGAIQNAAGNVGNAVSGAAGNVSDWADQAAGNVKNAVQNAGNWADQAARDLPGNINNAARDVGNWASNVPGQVSEFARGIPGNVAGAAREVGGVTNQLGSDIGRIARDTGRNVADFARDLPGNVSNFVDRNITGNSARNEAARYNTFAQNPNMDSVQQLMNQRAAENAHARADNTLFGRVGNAVNAVGDWASNVPGNIAGAANAMGDLAGQAAQNVGGAVDQAGRWIGDQARAAAASPAGQWLGNAAGNVGTWAGQAAQNVGNFANREFVQPFADLARAYGLDRMDETSGWYGRATQGPPLVPAAINWVRNNNPFVRHDALNEKPDGVSDAFWEKFTADGGTREEYERDWR